MNYEQRRSIKRRCIRSEHASVLVVSISATVLMIAGCGGVFLNNIPSDDKNTGVVLPAIVSQPKDVSVAIGQTATFSVTASGTASLSYQWQLNSIDIAGATSSIYATGATGAIDTGTTFDVVVSDSAGAATSGIATLTVTNASPPSLSSQPQNETVPIGKSATFSVSATGTGPLSYQWQKNSAVIDGATSARYTTPATSADNNSSRFEVIVSNSIGSTTSDPATLIVSVATNSSYFVATNGNDADEGSQSAPFATLGRAQIAMQASSIKVTQINAGTYYLTIPLNLTVLDQGETWEAVPGATVTLSGGEVLKGWVSEGSGIYSTEAPTRVGVDLEVAGVRQLPASMGYDPQQPYTSGWRVLPTAQARNFGVTFSVLPSDFTSSVKVGAILQTLDFLRYSDQFSTIVAVDPSTNSITVADQFNSGTSTTGVTGSWRILNDPADLGAPGEFAYDPATGKVYVEPVDPDSISDSTVVAAQLPTLITLKDVSNIAITGLTFSDTKSDKYMYSGAFTDKLATIMASNLINSSISGNTFLNVGNGLLLAASSSNLISGNRFAQVGGSGVFVTAKSNHNTITNNIMNGLGKINAGSTGIHLENSAYNLVDSNTIDGSGRWGVDLYPSDSVSLVGNTISNNVIRNTSQQTNDTGAIYSYAGTSPGYVNEKTTITGNRIENMGGLLRIADGTYVKGVTEAIYMDDQVSGVTITDNVIEGDGSGVFLCHGCESNSASNNVIVLQPATYYDRGTNGVTYSTGDMAYNGATRVDLLPSYFPSSISNSIIVVRLSGQAAGNTNAAFSVMADGVVIGTGAASSTASEFVFTSPLTVHQGHRIGIALTNGATTGSSSTALHNLGLFVNNTPVQLVDPEATGGYGALGFVVGSDHLLVHNFSATRNIVYRSAGEAQDVLDWNDWSLPSYVDPSPGFIDFNVLYHDVTTITDTVFGTQPTDAHSVIADPGFTNAQTGDYTLLPTSPAPGLGFNSAGVPLAP